MTDIVRAGALWARDSLDARLFPTLMGGDAQGSALALTFDDGPTPGLTARVGTLLADAGHQATFFVLLDRALSQPETIQLLVAQGHEIGLHGTEHRRMTETTRDELLRGLVAAGERLRAIGVPAVRLLRPPFGAQSRASYWATRRAGLIPVAWSVDVRDYAAQGLEDVADALQRGVRPGEILLLHDGDGDRPADALTERECALRLEIVAATLALMAERGLHSVTATALTAAGGRTGRWVHGTRATTSRRPAPRTRPARAAGGLRWPGPGDVVSAVIAHYGDPALTNALVDDLLAQEGTAVQVIVSDDAAPLPFPARDGVTVMRAAAGGGFGAAINRGAAAATGAWLLVLNNDVRLAPDFVSRACVQAAPWQPATCGFRQTAPGGSEPGSGRYPSLLSTAALHSRLLAPIVARRGWSVWTAGDPGEAGSVDWLVGSALLLSRALFDGVAGFDERYFMYMEEADLQRRLQLLGAPSILLPDLAILHASGSASDSLDIPVELLRSRLLYTEKWAGSSRARLLQALLRAGVALDLAADAGRLAFGRPAQPLADARARWSILTEARAPHRPRQRS